MYVYMFIESFVCTHANLIWALTLFLFGRCFKVLALSSCGVWCMVIEGVHLDGRLEQWAQTFLNLFRHRLSRFLVVPKARMWILVLQSSDFA